MKMSATILSVDHKWYFLLVTLLTAELDLRFAVLRYPKAFPRFMQITQTKVVRKVSDSLNSRN